MLKIQGVKAKVGMKVHDSWWPWQMGKVAKVLKTRVKIVMSSPYASSEVMTYDKAHLQFLKIG
jgi:hypothetical protein